MYGDRERSRSVWLPRLEIRKVPLAGNFRARANRALLSGGSRRTCCRRARPACFARSRFARPRRRRGYQRHRRWPSATAAARPRPRRTIAALLVQPPPPPPPTRPPLHHVTAARGPHRCRGAPERPASTRASARHWPAKWRPRALRRSCRAGRIPRMITSSRRLSVSTDRRAGPVRPRRRSNGPGAEDRARASRSNAAAGTRTAAAGGGTSVADSERASLISPITDRPDDGDSDRRDSDDDATATRGRAVAFRVRHSSVTRSSRSPAFPHSGRHGGGSPIALSLLPRASLSHSRLSR